VEAIKKYKECKQDEGNSVDVCSASGFIVNPSSPWLGARPGFLVSDSNEQTCSLGLGEVKCPFSKRENTIKEACEDHSFFLVLQKIRSCSNETMHTFIRFGVQWLHYNYSGVILLFIQKTICLLKE
jgi:hypothetical protein